ncbi:hypothetical protein ACRRTK_018137 [Alexandromys fortis]
MHQYDPISCMLLHPAPVEQCEDKKRSERQILNSATNQDLKVLNLPELIDDPKYKTNHLRVQNRKELVKILSARFAEEVTAKWLCLFEGSGIPYGPINSMKDVFSEAQESCMGGDGESPQMKKTYCQAGGGGLLYGEGVLCRRGIITKY